MKLKEIDLKAIIAINVLSAVLGLLYNSMSGKGIPLLKEKLSIEMASDSLLSEIDQNQVMDKPTDINIKTDENPGATKKEIKNEPVAESKKKEPLGIKLQKAYFLFSNNKAVFIDARDKWDFSDGHIKGALNIPDYSFDKNDPVVKSLDKDQIYIIYCGGDDCDSSIKLSKELSNLEFTNLYVFFGGWTEWQASGYPTETSTLDE